MGKGVALVGVVVALAVAVAWVVVLNDSTTLPRLVPPELKKLLAGLSLSLSGRSGGRGDHSMEEMEEGSGRPKVLVVGGGLAGMSAAIEAEAAGAEVVLIDKEKRIGGNSAKASSGINAVGTPAQKQAGIQDTIEIFLEDTLKSGHGLCKRDLVEVLVRESASAIEFLTAQGLELVTLSQCGGHLYPRTLRGKPAPDGTIRNVGWEITSTLEKKITSNPNIRVLNSLKLDSLSFSPEGTVTGVRALNLSDNNAVVELQADSVVLASGGFGFDRDYFLPKYASHLRSLPTTNGPWATGDGVRVAENAGANLILMNQVQVHPTGFVDPKDPTNPTKFLAPEALRGSGALLVNSQGDRFVNELGLRDHVTKAIFEHCQKWNDDSNAPTVAFAILNDAAVELFHRPVLTFYQKKGLVQQFNNAEELAKAFGMDPARLRSSIERYAESAKKGEDEFGKKTYPVILSPDEPLYVAITTPAIHYTMGGAEIDTEARVLDKNGKAKPGLFAAGEVSGGVHGANRLAGNSLLECVVFGRRAGRGAAAFAQKNKTAKL